MKIEHHLDEATVLSYASGTLKEALALVAACHVAWCRECRAAVREADAIGGYLMVESGSSEVSEGCRQRVFALADGAAVHPFPHRPGIKRETPLPLHRLLGGKPLAGLTWRRKAAGIALFDLPKPKDEPGRLFLMRLAPGTAMPAHSHGGEEITMVLTGAYRDALGRFTPGDVADLDEEIEHRPVVGKDVPCICLVATEAPTRLKSVVARLLQPFIGI